LRMWRDYLIRSRIVGIDIKEKRCPGLGRRVELVRADQSGVLSAMVDACRHPDIVIDDGSHVGDHIITRRGPARLASVTPSGADGCGGLSRRGLWVPTSPHLGVVRLPTGGASRSSSTTRPSYPTITSTSRTSLPTWRSVSDGFDRATSQRTRRPLRRGTSGTRSTRAARRTSA